MLVNDNGACNGLSLPGSFANLLRRKKGIEDARANVLRNSGPSILYLNLDVFGSIVRSDGDHTSLGPTIRGKILDSVGGVHNQVQ